MHIKQIIVEGFKTYKLRTVIDPFHAGHNAILGKNGHGKSNLFAAIQFVLSDKYAHLRQDERLALIHESSGAELRKASVEVVFDNSDNRFPIDDTTVRIKRDITDKEDNVWLNGKQLTKNDLANFLESAGLSRSNPYYIVEQGKVNSIIKMKDSERLELLKEIAGTRTYDERRKESLKIMTDTDNRRKQIQEVIQFINQRLEELGGEKEELVQFQVLDTDRRGLEYTIYDQELRNAVAKFAEIEANRHNSSEKASQMHTDAAKAQEARREAEDELKALRTDLAKLEAKQKQLQKDRHASIQAHEKAALQIKDLKDRLSTQQSRRAAAQQELKQLVSQVKKTTASLATVRADFATKQQAEEQARQRLQYCDQRLSEAFAKQGRASQFKTKKERDAFLSKEVKQLQKAVQEESQQRAELEAKLQQLKQEEQKYEAQLKQHQAKMADAKAVNQAATETLAQLKAERDQLANMRKELWKREATLSPQFSTAESSLEKADSQLQSSMDKSVLRGIQAIRKMTAEGAIAGVYGPLIELFDCEEKFYKCVETTAGNSLFHVVVDNDETATKVIQYLNKEKAGRVTFIPLANIHSSEQVYPKSSDAFAMIDKLQFDPRFRKAMLQVFGKTMVCRNIDVATQIARQHNFNTITMDGDQVNKKGALTGGFIDHRRSKLEAQKEIRKHKATFAEYTQQTAQVQQELADFEQKVTASLAKMQKEQAKKGHQNLVLEQLEIEVKVAQDKRSVVQKEIGETDKRIRLLTSSAAHATEKIQKYQEELSTDLHEGLSDEERQEIDDLTTEQTELKQKMIELSTLRSEAESEMKNLELLLSANLTKRQQELESTVAISGDEITEEVDKDDHEIRLLADTVEELDAQVKATDKAVDEKRERARTLESSLERLKADEAKAERTLAEESKGADKLMNRRALLLQKQEDCTRKIRDLGTVPSGHEKYKNKTVDQLIAMLEKVNTKLKKYSHVNKKALDQFISFTDQKKDLTKRHEELEAGRTSILELIEHLDQKKDEAIQRTFKTIAKHFTTVFSELVPDGKATLVIQTKKSSKKTSGKRKAADDDADEVDEADADQDQQDDAKDSNAAGATLNYDGIGIKVSFSGSTHYQTMRELSGGQQTVVALSLIFAIQRCDPSPFYLFDEIDAALDPTHRTAIAQMIHRQASGTQFLTTTFRPEMLATADKFYFVEFRHKVSKTSVISREEAVAFVRKVDREEAAAGKSSTS